MHPTNTDTPVNIAILAAGLGTRMKSRQAKVLHEAGGKPLLEHVIAAAREIAPAEHIFAIVGHQAERVRSAVREPGIRFVFQAEQKGTGHALMVCHDAMGGLPGLLVILYGDCPLITPATLRRLVAVQKGSRAAGTIVTGLLDDPTGYGRVLRDEAGNVQAVVEQKAATPEQLAMKESNMGIYCYDAPLFWKHVDEIRPDNPAHEYYLTDMVEIMLRAGRTMQAMPLDDAKEVMGINNRVELAEVDRMFRDRKVRQLMVDGVTIQKPETVTVDMGARIGADTVVEPFAQILGDTAIGENCRIGACAIIRDSQLGNDVHVGPFTVIGSSRLEDGAHAGPFSRLRMGNNVGAGAQVGNFVELKKTRLGARSKALHLAYLGDSEIGENVNIGAGTITCNFDGVNKHATRIADGAFVGSNATLVAPVEIGAGAYVAAASVITEAVPPDALAVGRARQVIKEGWAKKKRERACRSASPPAAKP
jgi:bifunctional UDP-N-acetylglucosamine pyrophosphorylase/glucosamine-1-phosphate N-acetyltransferase